MIDSVSAMSHAWSRTEQRPFVSSSRVWRASCAGNVTNHLGLDQLLESVADRRVQCARDRRLQATLFVRDRQDVGVEDKRGPFSRRERSAPIAVEGDCDRRSIGVSSERRQRRCHGRGQCLLGDRLRAEASHQGGEDGGELAEHQDVPCGDLRRHVARDVFDDPPEVVVGELLHRPAGQVRGWPAAGRPGSSRRRGEPWPGPGSTSPRMVAPAVFDAHTAKAHQVASAPHPASRRATANSW